LVYVARMPGGWRAALRVERVLAPSRIGPFQAASGIGGYHIFIFVADLHKLLTYVLLSRFKGA